MDFKVLDYNALCTKDGIVYLEKMGKIYRSRDFGETVEYIASYPGNMLEHFNELTSRVIRGGIHGFVVLPNSSIVAIKRKAILFRDKDSQRFEHVFDIPRGSRPLNLCYNPNTSKLYFGEYFSNDGRKEVYVYSSENGRKWSKVYAFPKGSIRHIHGIVFDKFRNGMWVLTGDTDKESHLWFTPDDFGTLKSIIGGTQKARTVSIIPAAENIVVPTDTPMEKNYIQLLDYECQTLKIVSDLPGSAFYAESVGGVNLVATVVEKSKVNIIDFVSVYASVDGKNWKNILNLKQDKYSSLSLKLFSYPEIKICKGEAEDRYIFLNCKGVEKYTGKCLRIPTLELRKVLK